MSTEEQQLSDDLAQVAGEFPPCGHSACRQNYIETGDRECICCALCGDPEEDHPTAACMEGEA